MVAHSEQGETQMTMHLSRRLAMSLIAGATIATLGVATPAWAAHYRVAAILQSQVNEYMVLWANAAKEHPAVKDGSISLTILDGQQDAVTQANLFDNAITEKYDAIIFSPVDIEAGNDPVRRANEAGIPVFGTVTAITHPELYKSFINSDDVAAGQILLKSVADKIGGKGNIVVIEGMMGQSAQVQRIDGITKALQSYPNIKVLETKTANWSRADAQSLTENWLTAHPDQINGIIAENDEMAIGALEAVKGHGLDPTKLPVAGIDGITDALLAVKRGEMMSTLQDADAQAKGSIDLVLRALEGPSYKPASKVWDVNGGTLAWDGGTERHYFVPWVPVTAQNVDALLTMRKAQ
jgi:ABC-type sugar transport system substrate-binding protein